MSTATVNTAIFATIALNSWNLLGIKLEKAMIDLQQICFSRSFVTDNYKTRLFGSKKLIEVTTSHYMTISSNISSTGPQPGKFTIF